MLLVFRFLMSLTGFCLTAGPVATIAGIYQHSGDQHLADVIGYSGFGLGAVMAVLIFGLSRKLLA